MEQLDNLYESIPKPIGFIERKFEVPDYSVNLFGPPGAGKTWLALDYLSRRPRKRVLYIDLADLRLDTKRLFQTLPTFVKSHEIETVVFDHANEPPPLPPVRQCIVLSRRPVPSSRFMPLLAVSPLDFEEYLAFEKRPLQPEHAFSQYLKTGALPAFAALHESRLTSAHHAYIRTLFCDRTDRALFRLLARFQGKSVTAHHLYTLAKKEYKISKNRLYDTLKTWEANGIVARLPKIGQPGAAGRILFFDFALPASLHFEKSLMGQLFTLAASHLLRRSAETAWCDAFDLIDPAASEGYIIAPFSDQRHGAERVAQKAARIDRLGLQGVTILTVANRYAFGFEKIRVRALPFYEWLLQS